MTQESSQSFPVPQQISDRVTQTRIELRLLRQLCFQPRMQPFHHRPALLLVPPQTLLGRERLFPRGRIVVINFAERLQNLPALAGEVWRDFGKLPYSMRHAVGQQDLYPNCFRSVSR